MQKQTYKIDQGENFGKWSDNTSKFLYQSSILEILNKIELPKKIADFGGGNGLLKEIVPSIITIDIDKTKKPDIVDNILTHKGKYDLIIIRYVLHYLNDYELIQLFNNIKSFHKGKLLIIQFCNNDLISKYFNSKNEIKYFRTENQTESLIPKGFKKIFSMNYICSKEFYKNRLQNENAIEHSEILNAYYYEN